MVQLNKCLKLKIFITIKSSRRVYFRLSSWELGSFSFFFSITELSKVSLFTQTSVIREASAMFARLLAYWSMSSTNFAMIATEATKTSTFIRSLAFSTVHARYHAFSYNQTIVISNCYSNSIYILTKFTSRSIESFRAFTFILLNTFSSIQTFLCTNSWNR